MKLILKSFLTKHYEAVTHLATSLATLAVLVTGLGRYRVIALFFVFFLLRAIFSYFKSRPSILYIFLLPLFLIFLAQDVKYGQFSPLFPDLNIAITIFSLVVIEVIVRLGTINAVRIYSDNRLFKVCPECFYDNTILTEKCENCAYKAGLNGAFMTHNQTSTQNVLSEKNKTILARNRKSGLLLKVNNRLLKTIRLKNNEVILINISIFPMRSFFKNGVRKAGSNFILTTERVIFVNFSLFGKGWRMKEDYSIDEITEVNIEKKLLVTKKEPVLSIKTKKDVLELYFIALFPFRRKITTIADCIKQLKSEILIKINLPEDQHKIKLEW